jgi:GNAT superfamily N-acetyltransferase
VTNWISSRLNDEYDLSTFDCSEPTLNEWLTGQARRAHESGTARTWVWAAPGDLKVVAYYSVCPTVVDREQISGNLAGGFTKIPAYLLARLALDVSLHGQGLGSDLLVDALSLMVKGAMDLGGRLIVVDAIDDKAAAFYQHHDFQPVKGNPHRLVIKVATAAKALG